MKNRYPFLNSKPLPQKIWKHIYDTAKVKGIFIDFINGYTDRCHRFVSMSADQTIQKIIQLLKGKSSFWINKNNLTNEKFEWQYEYYAVSVSESMIPQVCNYIRNQEEHHKKKRCSYRNNVFEF